VTSEAPFFIVVKAMMGDDDAWQFTDAETFATGLADGCELVKYEESDD
jgi:hypothetical protein